MGWWSLGNILFEVGDDMCDFIDVEFIWGMNKCLNL